MTDSRPTQTPQGSAATEQKGNECPDSAAAEVISILNALDVPIVVVGLDGKMTRYNWAAMEVLGVTRSDVGRHVRNMQALARFQNIEQMCARVIIDGIPSRHDIPHGDRWFLLHIAPHFGANRQVYGAVLTFTNVTAFRASIAQAVYEREFTKTILNTVFDPLVILDRDLRVQTANRAFYDWFGVSREKAAGVFLGDLGNNAWKLGAFWSALKRTLSDGHLFETVEVECDFSNGVRRLLLLDGRRIERDVNPLLLVGLRDITERKRAERSLRESEGHIRALFESIDEGYCVIEMLFDETSRPVDYRFLEVNPSFERQTGIKNAKGRLMREIAPELEQHWFDIYGRVALTGEAHRFEETAAAFHRDFSVYAFRIGAPELHRVGVVFTDVTSREGTRQKEAPLRWGHSLPADGASAPGGGPAPKSH